TKCAVAQWKVGNVEAPAAPSVEVGAFGSRGLVTPGIAALDRLKPSTLVCLACGRHFPLQLARKPAVGKPTKGFRLEPVHMNHRPLWLETHPSVEVSPLPIAAGSSPVDRVLGLSAQSPAPPLFAPEAGVLVPPLFHKPNELELSDGSLCHGKRG